MITNYIKVGIRNLRKYKTFSFINIFGLSIGMTVCMLVILMLADQYRYDRFHTKKDRIFRILSQRSALSDMPFASTPPSLASAIRAEYAVVEKATNLVSGVGGDATSEHATVEMRGFFADEYFLQVFDFALAEGDPENALLAPNTMVISSELSAKLFGNERALGKVVDFVDRGLHYLKSGKDSPPVPWGRFTITGVFTDKEQKSHLKFDVLVSASSQQVLAAEKKLSVQGDSWDKAYTYVLTGEGKSQEQLDASLNDIFKRKYAQAEWPKEAPLRAQPLTTITPGIMVNQPPSFQLHDQVYYFLAFIALAIMLSACLNYMNLCTARALTRAKEIGVRKVTGALRRDLLLQFLSESLLTSFFALSLAMLMILFIRPAFTGLWLNRYLDFELNLDLSVLGSFVIFALILGLVAGLYPALHLSAFQPLRAIKGADNQPMRKLGFRKLLSTAQFVISLFFIITSILIYAQFRYFMSFDYGFDSKGMVNVALQGNDFKRISESFSAIPGVVAISGSEYVPATGRTSGMDINKPQTGDAINFRALAADENFAGNMSLKFLAGKNLPPAIDSAGRQIIVNMTAVKALGFERPEEILGEVVTMTWNKEPLEIIGVVEDFWLKLPIGGDKLEPAYIRNDPRRLSFANVKISSTDIGATIAAMERRWRNADPVHSFKYEFYEDELASTHAGIFDIVSIVGYLAFIAISIACLGMLGMATYTAERKRKEVGIRKVLGAESLGLMFMLSKDFMKVLLLAICIGAPLSWYVNNLWLQRFANRGEFGIEIVLMGGFALLSLGLITIASQTLRASKTSPAEALRSD